MTFPEKSRRVIGWVSLAIGIWLVISAFVLPHTAQSQGNSWTMGVICSVLALIAAFGGHGALRLNVIFGGWLFLSTWLVPYASFGVRLHNALLGIALLAFALMPKPAPERREEAALQPRSATT